MFAPIEKRFETRDVKRILALDGIHTDRERIAAISDALGLGQRVGGARTWLPHEVELIQGVCVISNRLRVPFEVATQIMREGTDALEDRLIPIREAVRMGQAILAQTAA